jgi:hypothetical protein
MQKATRNYYEEILHSIFVYMLSAELEPAQVRSIVESALAQASLSLKKPVERDGIEFTLMIGGLFYRWFRDPRYLTAEANPRVIPLKGRAPSLEALSRGEGVRGKELDLFLEQIIDRKLVRAFPGNRFKPVDRAAVFTRLSPELIHHVGASFGRLLSTVKHNTTAKSRQIRLVERAASVVDLPSKDVPAFQEFSASQARSFLANMDDWLESRRVKRGTPRGAVKVRKAGVHVYAFLSP